MIQLQDVEVVQLLELNMSESNPLFVSAELQQHPVPEVILDNSGVEMQLMMQVELYQQSDSQLLLTQQSDIETPQSVGCCVLDDGYGVANKLDIDEPPHGCNDSDHDGDDCDSNDELLSWVRVILKEAAKHPPPMTTAASSLASSSTTSNSTTERLTAEHPPPMTTTTTAAGATPTTLTAATPTALTVAESTITTPPVLRSATKKAALSIAPPVQRPAGKRAASSTPKSPVQRPSWKRAASSTPKSPGQRPSRKRVASSTAMSPGQRPSQKRVASSTPTSPRKRPSRKRVASSTPTLPRKRPARKENTSYSSLPTVSATLVVHRQSRGLPDHPSMENDV